LKLGPRNIHLPVDSKNNSERKRDGTQNKGVIFDEFLRGGLHEKYALETWN